VNIWAAQYHDQWWWQEHMKAVIRRLHLSDICMKKIYVQTRINTVAASATIQNEQYK